jgi:hypothetical protein
LTMEKTLQMNLECPHLSLFPTKRNKPSKIWNSFLERTCRLTRFAWWRQDLHAIELLRARIGEWTMTRMLDYWWVMCFTDYRLNWNSWIWIPFPVDSDRTLLCSQVDRTRYSSIASGNNCIVQLCKCVSLHLKWALWIHPMYS